MRDKLPKIRIIFFGLLLLLHPLKSEVLSTQENEKILHLLRKAKQYNDSGQLNLSKFSFLKSKTIVTKKPHGASVTIKKIALIVSMEKDRARARAFLLRGYEKVDLMPQIKINKHLEKIPSQIETKRLLKQAIQDGNVKAVRNLSHLLSDRSETNFPIWKILLAIMLFSVGIWQVLESIREHPVQHGDD